jgi:hypothetical protein
MVDDEVACGDNEDVATGDMKCGGVNLKKKSNAFRYNFLSLF